MKKRRLKAITLEKAIEKSPMLLSQNHFPFSCTNIFLPAINGRGRTYEGPARGQMKRNVAYAKGLTVTKYVYEIENGTYFSYKQMLEFFYISVSKSILIVVN